MPQTECLPDPHPCAAKELQKEPISPAATPVEQDREVLRSDDLGGAGGHATDLDLLPRLMATGVRQERLVADPGEAAVPSGQLQRHRRIEPPVEAVESTQRRDLPLQGSLGHGRSDRRKDADSSLPGRRRQPQPPDPLSDTRHRHRPPVPIGHLDPGERSARSWAYALTVFGEYPSPTE